MKSTSVLALAASALVAAATAPMALAAPPRGIPALPEKHIFKPQSPPLGLFKIQQEAAARRLEAQEAAVNPKLQDGIPALPKLDIFRDDAPKPVPAGKEDTEPASGRRRLGDNLDDARLAKFKGIPALPDNHIFNEGPAVPQGLYELQHGTARRRELEEAAAKNIPAIPEDRTFRPKVDDNTDRALRH